MAKKNRAPQAKKPQTVNTATTAPSGTTPTATTESTTTEESGESDATGDGTTTENTETTTTEGASTEDANPSEATIDEDDDIEPSFGMVPIEQIARDGNIRRVATPGEKIRRADHIGAMVESLLSHYGQGLNKSGLIVPISIYRNGVNAYKVQAGFTRLEAFYYIANMSDEAAQVSKTKHGLPANFRDTYRNITCTIANKAPSTEVRIRNMLGENESDTRRGLTMMDLAFSIEELSNTAIGRRAPKKGKATETVVDYAAIAMYFPGHTEAHVRQIHTLLQCDDRIQDAVSDNWMPYTDAVKTAKTPPDKIGEVLKTYKAIVDGTSKMQKNEWAILVSDINKAANPNEGRGRKRSAEKEEAKAAAALDARVGGGTTETDPKGAVTTEDGAKDEKSDKAAPKAEKPGKTPVGPGALDNLLATYMANLFADAKMSSEISVTPTATAEGRSLVIKYAAGSAGVILEAMMEEHGVSKEIREMFETINGGAAKSAE